MIACSVFHNKIRDVDKSHAYLANVQRNILSKESFDIYDRAKKGKLRMSSVLSPEEEAAVLGQNIASMKDEQHVDYPVLPPRDKFNSDFSTLA